MTCCDDKPEDAARYKCEKHQITMCAECLKCKDPDLYCKFRPSCMIHFLEKEQKAS
jgi:hypothetical protein